MFGWEKENIVKKLQMTIYFLLFSREANFITPKIIIYNKFIDFDNNYFKIHIKHNFKLIGVV